MYNIVWFSSRDAYSKESQYDDHSWLKFEMSNKFFEWAQSFYSRQPVVRVTGIFDFNKMPDLTDDF